MALLPIPKFSKPPSPPTPTADEVELELQQQSRLKGIGRVLRKLGLMRLEDTEDVGLSNLKVKMGEAPQMVLNGLRRLGRNPDSETFLKSLKPDIDEDGLRTIFGTPPPVTPPPPVPPPELPPATPPAGREVALRASFQPQPPLAEIIAEQVKESRNIPAEEAVRRLQEQPELPTQDWLDRASEVAKNPVQLVPFLSTAVEFGTLSAVNRAANALEAGEAISETELRLLTEFINKANTDKTWGARVMDVIAQMPPFAGEIAATGGLFGVAKTGAQKAGTAALTRLIGRAVERKAAQLAVRGVAGAVAAGVAGVPAAGVRTPAGIQERQAVAALTGDEESVWESAVKAFGAAWVETASERTGGALGTLASPIKGQLMKSALLRSILRLNPGKTSGNVNKLFERFGYHGVFGEIFEERVAEVGHGLLAEAGLGDEPFKLPSLEQLSIEFVAFLVPSAAAQVTGGLPEAIGDVSETTRRLVSETGATVPGRPQPVEPEVTKLETYEKMGKQIPIGWKVEQKAGKWTVFDPNGIIRGKRPTFAQATNFAIKYATDRAEEARRVPVELKRMVTEERGGVKLPGKMPEGAKEPWQMTKEVFVLSEIEEFTLQKGYAPTREGQMLAYDRHYDLVKQALSEGKPVPAEVVKDYPDLAKAVSPAELVTPAVPEVTEVLAVTQRAKSQKNTFVKAGGKWYQERFTQTPDEGLRTTYLPQVSRSRIAFLNKNAFPVEGETISIVPSPVAVAAPQPVVAEPTVTAPEGALAPFGAEGALEAAPGEGISQPPPGQPPTAGELPPPPAVTAEPQAEKVESPGVAAGFPPVDKVPFPTEPVIKEDGKLWLPEPPRSTTELIAAARKAVPGSYRGKKGFFDTIEDAHQLVLKARDMGTNAVPYVMSYIRRIGNVSNEFGVDAQGLVTKVGNPENRSLAINDVLSNYTHYELTAKQIELAKGHGFVYAEALKLAKSYGVEINELGSSDEYWQYIARRVVSKLDPFTGKFVSPPATTGAFRMGAKISAQKERVFDEMAQGVNLGFLYENPEQTMPHHILGIYRLIGNKQAEILVMPFTRGISAKAPLQFGERAIAQPALRQRAAAVEIADAIDKIFTPEQENRALRIAADASGAVVGQIAALDVSAPFIQGLPLLGHDFKQNLLGRPSAVWAKSYGHMWKAVFNPETINNFRMQHQDLYKRYIEAGGMTGESEFVVGVGTTQRAMGKIPWAGKTVSEVYRQTWGRLGAAYSDFLEVAKVRYFEQMESVWQREGRNMLELGALTNRMMGATSAAARGVGANRRLIERILAFAPNYLRSSLLLMKDMAGRGATAREVQLSIAAMLAIWAAFYWSGEKLRGREPKMKPWPKRLGGDGASAYTIEVGGINIGFGGWTYGIIKMLGEVSAIAVDEPKALLKWNEWHPVNKFLRSKRGPVLSLVADLATGKNFFGQRFEDGSDYLLRLAESVVPIAGQSFLDPRITGARKIILSAAEFAGLRAFPASSVDRIDTAMTKLGLAGATKDNLRERQQLYDDYWDIPTDPLELKSAIAKGEVRLSREDYREDNPDVDAKLFIGGQVRTIKTLEAYELVSELVKQLKIRPEDISAVKVWQADEEKRQKFGVEDKTESLTERLIKELLGIPSTSIIPSIDTVKELQAMAKEYGVPLNLSTAFHLTEEGKERFPSDRKLWKSYFDYYALPSTSYLNFTQEQVNAGLLPEKYRKEWETYHKFTTESAREAFKKARAHKEITRGDRRDEFRRGNTDLDEWLQENKDLKPLPKKGGASRANVRAQSVRSLFGGFRPVSGRRRLAKPAFTFPKPRMTASIGAPRAPSV